MSPRDKTYGAVIVLSGQIVREESGGVSLAFHTEMRARAAGLTYSLGMTRTLVITGGHNVGVRYSLRDNRVFERPNLSPFALIKAKLYPSEASVMAEFVHRKYAVPRGAMILEENSIDTRQNAQECRRIIKRLCPKSIGVLTLLYHMERAIEDFAMEGLKAEPIYAEDLLILEDRSWVDRIVEYYSSPRGGKQWNPHKIRTNLQEGKGVSAGLVQI